MKKLLIIGNGKMGKMLAQLSAEYGFEVMAMLGESDSLSESLAKKPDVAIEFTSPHSAAMNVRECLLAGIPIVSGSTGWNANLAEMQKLCLEKEGSFIWGSNFSIGVNIWFKMVTYAAQWYRQTGAYTAEMQETHHLEKLDKPSGTAISAAELFCREVPEIHSWISDEKSDELLPIFSFRKENVVGFHELILDSNFDSIKISHSAKSRIGFAKGALLASQWILNNKGSFIFSEIFEKVLCSNNKL